MKIKEGVSLDELLNYGFIKIKGEHDEYDYEDEYVVSSYQYKFEIGHSRRGQYYYLLVSEKYRSILVYSSEPDGGGGVAEMPSVLIQMSIDGIITA